MAALRWSAVPHGPGVGVFGNPVAGVEGRYAMLVLSSSSCLSHPSLMHE